MHARVLDPCWRSGLSPPKLPPLQVLLIGGRRTLSQMKACWVLWSLMGLHSLASHGSFFQVLYSAGRVALFSMKACSSLDTRMCSSSQAQFISECVNLTLMDVCFGITLQLPFRPWRLQEHHFRLSHLGMCSVLRFAHKYDRRGTRQMSFGDSIFSIIASPFGQPGSFNVFQYFRSEQLYEWIFRHWLLVEIVLTQIWWDTGYTKRKLWCWAYSLKHTYWHQQRIYHLYSPTQVLEYDVRRNYGAGIWTMFPVHLRFLAVSTWKCRLFTVNDCWSSADVSSDFLFVHLNWFWKILIASTELVIKLEGEDQKRWKTNNSWPKSSLNRYSDCNCRKSNNPSTGCTHQRIPHGCILRLPIAGRAANASHEYVWKV